MTAATALLLGVFLFARSAEDVGFTGVWERDPERSDDPKEKMREAVEAMREPMGQRGGRRGGRRGMGGRRGGGKERVGGGRPEIERSADELTLELRDGELHVDDGERVRIYYLDGETHARETANGTKLETVAARAGAAVTIEEKMERGQIHRKFELSPDGKTMIVTVNVRLGRTDYMDRPVVIRSVYERTSEASF